jgi:hypothetical protein
MMIMTLIIIIKIIKTVDLPQLYVTRIPFLYSSLSRKLMCNGGIVENKYNNGHKISSRS